MTRSEKRLLPFLCSFQDFLFDNGIWNYTRPAMQRFSISTILHLETSSKDPVLKVEINTFLFPVMQHHFYQTTFMKIVLKIAPSSCELQ